MHATGLLEKAMLGKTWISALALTLAASVAGAQTAAAPAAPPPANPVDATSIQALQAMGTHLQSLQRFSVSTEVTGERVLADGQKLQHSARAVVDVARPNRLRARMTGPRTERELFYDGKAVTLFTPAQKYYSTVEFSGSVAELVSRLQERYGVEVPLSDLFLWGTAAAPIDRIQSAMYVGQAVIGGERTDQYAFRQGNFDWQLWMTTGDKPLPRKLVIVNRADEARPQSVSLITWNLRPAFTDAAFRFTPPKGGSRIELVPLKAQ
jgi:hypothetical protein